MPKLRRRTYVYSHSHHELSSVAHAASADSGVVFVIGGAYGVSDEVKSKAQLTWSLSLLVFPHELVRSILAEQIYRGFTIVRGEKYHHE
mgnify:CR=1 FL=1